MQCNRCGRRTPEDELFDHATGTLCEDCYISAINPVRTCDPWAVFTAKHAPHAESLTPLQQRIVDIVDKRQPLSHAALGEAAGLEPLDLEHELATLAHMAVIRARRLDSGEVVLMRSTTGKE
ncbi:conserved hypothetical protein [Desulfarculus baarsii DSM 2075]|uniref:Uncharacterized protein n=1 Tax=Desulfarculus baarsii (strain ATCC 33931 / DSM 2075 / LMG 7858 / VKM B-1802 / 2st14) TaxID=644282 RepID=E1QJY7_DESB2|nr:hypothetical protein [Desulfarculus baarsii]ADK85880.1 conserved hypothetical protein [Desulfarculus baarsii DSM 2075]